MKAVLLIPLLFAAPLCAQDADTGGVLFQNHCAACHGAAAKGDGPMVPILNITPPNLTGLSDRAGGKFPLEMVVRRIDGRDSVLAHGGTMPVFGNLLQGESGVIDGATGAPIFTPLPVIDLAAWLESVQR